MLLVIELFPGNRVLHSAAVPEVYQLIRDQDVGGRLLELPSGIRDGTSSIGDFSASTAFYQTVHELPVIGGYVSRVSEWRKRENLKIPMLRAIFELSEGRELAPERADEARRSRQQFLERSCVRFVLMDKSRVSRKLRDFADEALRLSLVHEDDQRALYIPTDPPPCQAPPRLARSWKRKGASHLPAAILSSR